MRRLKARVRLVRQKVRRAFREPEVPSEIHKGIMEAQIKKIELMRQSGMFGRIKKPQGPDDRKLD